MNIPSGLFLFGLIYFLLMAGVSSIQAFQKKENPYYITTAICLFMVLAYVFIFLDHRLLMIVVFITAVLLSIMGLPKMLKEWSGLLPESDIVGPVRGRDFFTRKVWLKLASRWGVWKAYFLNKLIGILIIGGVLFILYLWDMMSRLYVVTCTIA